MAYREFNGIQLEEQETVKAETTISKAGLLGSWISIPSVLLIGFMVTYMPYIVKMILSKAFRQAIIKQFNAGSFSDLDISAIISELVFGNIPKTLIVLICIPIALLVVAWLGLCLYKTRGYFNYCLALTDRRVIGKAAHEELAAPLDEIVNVFIELPLLGRIFKYGNIVVHTKKKSLTFKNIHDPTKMYKMIMSYAENYASH